jgi:N6-adenosine-specific RNA methylase IME4
MSSTGAKKLSLAEKIQDLVDTYDKPYTAEELDKFKAILKNFDDGDLKVAKEMHLALSSEEKPKFKKFRTDIQLIVAMKKELDKEISELKAQKNTLADQLVRLDTQRRDVTNHYGMQLTDDLRRVTLSTTNGAQSSAKTTTPFVTTMTRK